jgi:TolB-like protein
MLLAFRFGRFELHPAARELRKDGVRMRLQDQPFELLSMLLERPGEVLTRDELRQHLWPQGMFVDFEHGLNAAVKRVRSALGDDADNPRFVETLRGRGYRFVASVETHDHEGSTLPARTPSRLAVLPFTDLGEPSAPRFFTDGLTDEMITRVGRLLAGRIRIITRSSSLLAQRNATTARQIGAALRVQFVVEGRVRREGDLARITVQLIETNGETLVWADSYERRLTDCFRVQSEVAEQIAHALAMELLPYEGTP